MSADNILDKVKQLRELTGVGFKDCKIAIDESNGDIEKSVEYLRKKGIAKASKKMQRVAADGLVCIHEKNNKYAIVEVNSETDFVAKNDEFISFCKEVSKINFKNKADLLKVNQSSMKNNLTVETNLIDLIAKIGEKITIRRAIFFDNKNGENSFYIHGAIESRIGKIVSIVKASKKNIFSSKFLAIRLRLCGKMQAIDANLPASVAPCSLNPLSTRHCCSVSLAEASMGLNLSITASLVLNKFMARERFISYLSIILNLDIGSIKKHK